MFFFFQEKELVEIGYMVSFAGLYKSLKEKRRALIYSSLLQLDDVEERIDFLQDFILGKTVERWVFISTAF